MDKELLDILDKARANGATATQLQGIVDSYNAKKKSTETESTNFSNGLSPTKSSEDNSIKTVFGNQFNDLGLPQLSQENGSPLTIDPKTIPVTPFANQSEYVIGLQERLTTNKLTPQDSQVIYKNTNPISTFNSNDDAELQRLSELNKLSIESISALKIPASISALIPEFENKSIGEVIDSPEAKYTQALQLKGNIVSEIDRLSVSANPKAPKSADEKQKISEKQRELNQVEMLIKKLSTQLADKGEKSIEATLRTDESGNAFNKTLNRLQAMMPGTGLTGQVAITQETVDRVEQLPPSFSIGLSYYKYADPVVFERVSKSLQTGEPISESQIAQITAQGLSIEENRLKDKYNQQAITRDEYVNGIRDIQVGRSENLLGNKETLRAFLSSGIAELADDANVAISSQLPAAQLGSKVFGHRWNYTDSEIEMYGKAYAKANGLDPNDARVVGAIKYLQDNEGSMFLKNSIAKAGWARDLSKGLAQPIRGISSSIEDFGKSGAEIYAESQSQGNVNVSEKRLERVENSWEGTVSAVMEGAGQFITQAAIAWGTSGILGATARGLIGTRAVTGAVEAGLVTDEAVIAGNSIGAGVDLGSTSIAQSLGKRLLATKDFTSTLITSYAQSYDNNLKTALSYTSDDKTAKQVAGGMSLLEGLTENILSPLEVSRGIIKAVFKPKGATEGVLKIINDANIVDKQSAVSSFLKSTLKGGLATAKVVGSEILEDEVTQVADYAANAIMNPDSQSFMNRDLQSEILNTANQTGLSMVIPALLSGVGAANANNFSKGTLLIAAQNRQHLLDDMNKRLFVGDLTQDEYNEKAAIINTAAKANETLPAKANGAKLNTQEKADYVYSRVAEGVLNKRLTESEDVAEKSIIESKIKEQQDFRIKLLQNENKNINTIPEGENAEGKDAKSAIAKTATGTSTENKLNDGLVIQSAVIEIGGKQYEGNNHAEAILKAKEAGEDISNVDRQAEGKFKLSDGTIIDRTTAKEQFGQDKAELLIPQNEAANQANKDYAKITDAKAEPDISVGEMIDKPGTYNGETGRFYQDGQAVIFKVEGKNKEYELGNIEEMKNTPISDMNITYEQSVVSISDEGNIKVRDTEYLNNFSSPLAAINRDAEGNVVSVNLDTPDGKKRTFRGNIAEDIAYQISLKEINKNNETRTEFEQFINEDETASKEMDNGAVLETTKKEPVKNNEPVSREKVAQEVKSQPQPNKAETPTTNTGVEEGSVGVGGDVKALSNTDRKILESNNFKDVDGMMMNMEGTRAWSKLSDSTKKLLKKYGIHYIEGYVNFDHLKGGETSHGNFVKLKNGEANGIQVNVSSVGDKFNIEKTILHELGHKVYEGLSSEQKKQLERDPITQHGKEVKKNVEDGGKTYKKEDIGEEDFAELFAEKKGDLKAVEQSLSKQESGASNVGGDVESKKQKAFDKFDEPNIQKEVKQTSDILRKVLPTKIGNYIFEKLFSVGGNWHITYRTETERTNIHTGEKYTDVSEQSFPLDKEDILNLSETELLAKIEERANKNGIQGKAVEQSPTKSEPTVKEETSTVSEKETEVPIAEIGDVEYNDFIDKGKVLDLRLNDIARKVKNQEPLSEREKEIFTDKTSEINKIIATQPTNEAKAIEVQQPTEVEPDLGNGRTPVTLSGNTESERQLAIDKRKKETKQTPLVSDRDSILERIWKFNKLSKVKKRQSFNEENNIKVLVDSFNKKHNQKHTVSKLSNGDLEMRGNPTAKKSLGSIIKFTLKGEEKNIVDNAKPLMERSDKTKQVFSDLLEANSLPVARRINGEKMSDIEFDGTIQDIMEGIPSQRAENYLNSLENQIEEDAFDYGNPDKNVPLPTLNDVLGVTVEETEQMTPESIDEWLSRESEFTPEEEILFDNIENLITYYEQEQSEPESGNAEKISATTGTGQESNITEDKQDQGEKPKDTGNTNVANAEVDKSVKISEKMRSFAASIRKNGITPDFLKIDDGNAKTKGLSAKQVDEFIATTIEKVADLIDAGTKISDAIKQGIADIKNLYDQNNVPVDEAKLTEWFTDLINNQAGVEEDVNEVAKKIKSDEITYIDAVDGKSQEFIDALDEALKGKRAYTFNEEGFRSNVRRQKEYGISKEDIIEGYESVKKLTKRQKELIDEVFGETADTDKAAADLMEAFRQLAKGEKPKKVLKRLAASDVTSLVQALSNALSYKAISNVQLEAMADYIVESIDLNKSEQYLNAMVNNSMVDVKQLVRAKLIIKLQEAGNDGLATTLVNQMADDAVSSGRATQSLVKAYEILGAKGNAKVRTAFAKKYAESVQEKALKMNQHMSDVISEKEAEIGRLNQRIHNETQKSSSLSKLKDIIANLCGLRNKK